MSRKPMTRLLWLTVPALLILQACASQAPIPATSDAGCIEFPRLTFDRLADTLPTIAQIKAYNARRDAVCGPGK
jgi:hypothetical protein